MNFGELRESSKAWDRFNFLAILFRGEIVRVRFRCYGRTMILNRRCKLHRDLANLLSAFRENSTLVRYETKDICTLSCLIR